MLVVSLLLQAIKFRLNRIVKNEEEEEEEKTKKKGRNDFLKTIHLRF